ncbi:helix-turn-helix domain-containing protein [Streptomyces macrosporus]
MRLLTTWFDHGCRATEVAEALGLHHNTVAARLSKTSAALCRQLGEQGSGTHEVLLALCAAGVLPLATLPPATPGRINELLMPYAS